LNSFNVMQNIFHCFNALYLRDFASAEVLFDHMVNSLLLFQIDEFFESVVGTFAAQSLIRLREEVENMFESKGE